MINEIHQYNRRFVSNKRYERFISSKYPDTGIAIVRGYIMEPVTQQLNPFES